MQTDKQNAKNLRRFGLNHVKSIDTMRDVPTYAGSLNYLTFLMLVLSHARLRYTSERYWNIDWYVGQLFSQINMDVAPIPADAGFDCQSPVFTQLPQRLTRWSIERHI